MYDSTCKWYPVCSVVTFIFTICHKFFSFFSTIRSTVQIASILLLNNCCVGAIMQCLFNNPKMMIFDQLTAGHPSHCDIACCMTGKLNNWAVLYAALVTLSHTDRSNMQPCNLSAALVPSEWCSALIHPILKPNTPDLRKYRGIALQSVVLQVLCKVLNARLSETSYILSDEQNCFRPDHSCLDHLCHLQCYWSQKKKSFPNLLPL